VESDSLLPESPLDSLEGRLAGFRGAFMGYEYQIVCQYALYARRKKERTFPLMALGGATEVGAFAFAFSCMVRS
jgi:hypothetical protein